jgi:hypothetical protein
MVKMDLTSPLASRLSETDVNSQQAQFNLLYRNLRHTTTRTINRSQMLHEHGVWNQA